MAFVECRYKYSSSSPVVSGQKVINDDFIKDYFIQQNMDVEDNHEIILMQLTSKIIRKCKIHDITNTVIFKVESILV